MDKDSIYNELILLADKEFENIKQALPQDTISCLGLLIESVRVLDFIMLGQPGVPKSDKISFSVIDLNMIEMGWNLACSMLLKAGNFYGVPMRQSTDDTREQVISLLYQLGTVVQLRRMAEMGKAGIVNVIKDYPTYSFYMKPEAMDQFQDELELGVLDKLEEKMKSSGGTYKEWALVDRKTIEDIFWQVGNFMSVKYEGDFASYEIEDIDSRMIPLIKQWNSGKYGIMIGYDSTPEIDNHFLAIAAELTREWRDEAGIDPKTKIGNINATHILMVTMVIISFHLKHIRFTQLASEKDPDILIPQSMSIWNPIHDLIKDIAEYSGLDQAIVQEAISTITLRPGDTDFLKNHTTRFRPLLIEIGSGFVLRPVSCVMRNPLLSVYALLESRDPSSIDRISNSREEWLRKYLYAMFVGSRYQRVEGNIKIRKEGKIITDIDAAIYDNLTGELAIFQIKWQDFFTNDVKKLRSRSKNFVDKINRWTEAIESWIITDDLSRIIKTLKLKSVTNKLTKSKIYLFGLGKNTAHTRGYGYALNNQHIAIATWAQFVRNRIEIGPAPQVISQLFQNLKNEENNYKVNCKPMPVKIPFGDVTLDFRDICSITD